MYLKLIKYSLKYITLTFKTIRKFVKEKMHVLNKNL